MKTITLITLLLISFAATAQTTDVFQLPDGQQTGWISFENPKGQKGAGGLENKQAKGHAWDVVAAGKTIKLADISGTAIIKRIWLTLSDRSPKMLRSVYINMFWDDAAKPAVSVPIGDFFGIGLGMKRPFQSVFFSDPEGRSFNSILPMPFKKSAKIEIVNQSDKNLTIFYDIDFIKLKRLPKGSAYLHAYWSSNAATKLGQDFAILPKVTGKGRYLGANFGIITDSIYSTSWWGEGECKMYIDGDGKSPSLVGSGTEDYIGTAYKQGAFANQFQGCPVADSKKGVWAFYRYHVPDPVYFEKDCKVVMQQMGGDNLAHVRALLKAGARLIPVSITTANYHDKFNLLDSPLKQSINDPSFPDGWVNFYRLDNYSATAYFYLDKPGDDLPALAPLNERLRGL